MTHVKDVRHTHAGRVTQMERARCGTDMKEAGEDMKEAGDLSCLVHRHIVCAHRVTVCVTIRVTVRAVTLCAHTMSPESNCITLDMKEAGNLSCLV